jgi:hypothetical protein
LAADLVLNASLSFRLIAKRETSKMNPIHVKGGELFTWKHGGGERAEVHDGAVVLLVLMLLMLLGLAVHQLTPASCYYVYTEREYEETEGDIGDDPAKEEIQPEGSYGSTEQ